MGRTKDIINSLTEIKDNVKDFYRSDSKKYGALKDKNYKEIVFYEVDIDEYLSLAYYFIRAAYVEGKLGFETLASMYHKSSLDEYFFDYYKRNKLSEII